MTETLQLLGEAPLLLIVEARKQRLSGIGERLLTDGPLTQKSGLFAHLLDHVEEPLQLRALSSQGDLEICVSLANVFHGTFDGTPIVCLLGRKAQVSFDMGSARGELIVDLVCRKLSSLPAIAATGRTGPLWNSEDTLDATDNPAADDPAYRMEREFSMAGSFRAR